MDTCTAGGVISGYWAMGRDKSAMAPINRGFLTAGVLTIVGTFVVAMGYVGNHHNNEGWKCFAAVVSGLMAPTSEVIVINRFLMCRS